MTCVDTEKLVRAVLSRWQAEMKAGRRKEAERTLSLLVRALQTPRKDLPRISQHLADSKVKKGATVVAKTKSWKNAGSSRHARSRATVLKVTDGVAKCQYERRVFAYDLIDGKGEWHFGVDPSKVRATDRSEKTKPGGNSLTPRFKSKTPVEMKTDDGNLALALTLTLTLKLTLTNPRPYTDPNTNTKTNTNTNPSCTNPHTPLTHLP